MNRFFVFGLSLLAVLAAAGALRLVWLDADPPADVHRHFITDEGWWARNARNHALFGDWVLDDFNPGLGSAPLYTYAVSTSYALFGVGLVQTRLVAAFFGLVTVAAIGIALGCDRGRWAALAGMGIWAVDYFAVMYNRVAFVEAVPTALMALAFAVYLGKRYRSLRCATAGGLAVLACFSKMNAVFFLPVLPLATLIHCWGFAQAPARGWFRRARPELIGFLSGCVVSSIAFLCIAVLPHWQEFVAENVRHGAENRPAFGLYLLSRPWTWGMREESGYLTNTGFLTQCVLPIGLASLWFLHTGSCMFRDGFRVALRGLSRMELAALLWIVWDSTFIAFSGHSADRRYLELVVPLVLLGGRTLTACRTELFLVYSDWKCPRWSLRTLGYALAGTVPFIVYLRAPLTNALLPFTQGVSLGSRSGLSVAAVCAVATLLITICGLLLVPGILRFVSSRNPRLFMVSLAVCAVCMIMEGGRYAAAITNLSFSTMSASRSLAETMNRDSLVAGGMADTLLLDSEAKTITILDRRHLGLGVINASRAAELRPTHCLLDGFVADSDMSAAVRIYLGTETVVAEQPGKHISLCPDESGIPRFEATLCSVRYTDAGD